MKLQQVKRSALIPAPYNPEIRTRKKEIKSLLQSIDDIGMIMPIVVDKKMNVIDGHRRLACAKKLKMEIVPVLISDSTFNQDKLYETMNDTQRKMSQSEMIYVYVHGGCVPKVTEKKIKQLESILGKTELAKVGNKYVSVHILSFGQTVSKYCKENSPEFIKKAILWGIKHKQTYQARRAMEDRISIATMKKAVLSNRPLKHNWK